MPAGLAKQTIDIDLTGGLDNKSDEVTTLPSKVTTLENGSFADKKTIKRDGGYTQRSTTVITGGGTALATGRRLAKRGEELLIEADTGLYSVMKGDSGQAQGSLQRAANFIRTSVSVRDVVRNGAEQTEIDVAFASTGSRKMSVWVWRDNGTTEVHYMVLDEATQTVYLKPTRLAADTVVGKVIWDAANSIFRIFYLKTATGELAMREIAPATPMAISGELVLASGAQVASEFWLDATYVSATSKSYVVFRRPGATGLTLVRTDERVLGGGLTESKTLLGATNVTQGGAVHVFSGGKICVAAASGVVGLTVVTQPTAFVDAPASVVLNAATGITHPALIPNSSNMRVIWEDGSFGYGTRDTDRFTTAQDVTDAPAAVASTTATYRGVGLVSEPFAVGSAFYVLLNFYQAVQSTIFVADISSDSNGHSVTNAGIVARVLPGQAGAYKDAWGAINHIPSTYVDGSTVTVPILRRGALELVGGVDVTPSGLSRLTVRFP